MTTDESQCLIGSSVIFHLTFNIRSVSRWHLSEFFNVFPTLLCTAHSLVHFHSETGKEMDGPVRLPAILSVSWQRLHKISMATWLTNQDNLRTVNNNRRIWKAKV